MPENDRALDQRDGLISAAHAATSWVRARRAHWTSAPLTAVAAPPAARAPEFVFEPPPAEVFEPPPAEIFEPPPADIFEPTPAGVPSAIEAVPDLLVSAPSRPPADSGSRPAATTRRLAPGGPALRWIASGAIAGALVAAAVIGGPYLWNALPQLPARTAPAEPAPVGATAAGNTAGSLRVISNPAGAQVIVDGKARGVTPLEITDLSPGRHEVTLQGDGGSVKRTVSVSAKTTVTIDEAIFSGFVTVYSPFDVMVSEGGRVLRADDRQQIMLPPGVHELRLTNRALEYDVVRRVDVKPGEATNLQLTPGPSALTVTAASPAEVWLDGARLGDTPLNAAPVPLGVHEILVKRAAGGERRYTVTIGTKPSTLNVEF